MWFLDHSSRERNPLPIAQQAVVIILTGMCMSHLDGRANAMDEADCHAIATISTRNEGDHRTIGRPAWVRIGAGVMEQQPGRAIVYI